MRWWAAIPREPLRPARPAGPGGIDGLPNPGVQAVGKIFARQPEAHSGNVCGQSRRVIGCRVGQRGGIPGIVPRYSLQNHGAAFRIPGDGTQLIQWEA